MPKTTWLFDEQGRMRDDLPPVNEPYSGPAYLQGYGNGMEASPAPLNGMSGPKLNMDVLNKLGLDIEPDITGGWRFRPKRWKNPTPGEDWYGVYGEANLEDVPFFNRLFGYR